MVVQSTCNLAEYLFGNGMIWGGNTHHFPRVLFMKIVSPKSSVQPSLLIPVRNIFPPLDTVRELLKSIKKKHRITGLHVQKHTQCSKSVVMESVLTTGTCPRGQNTYFLMLFLRKRAISDDRNNFHLEH